MIRAFFIVCTILALWLVPQTVGAVDENPFDERTVEDALSSPLQSNEDTPTSTAILSQDTNSASFIKALLNMVVALLLVLSLIYVFYRLFLRRQLHFRPAGGIRHVAGYALGPQKSVQLLEIGGKIYVLGVADDIRLLRLIEDPDETEKLLSHLSAEGQTLLPTHVTELLQARIDRMKQQRRLWLNRLRRQYDTGDGEERG